MSVGRTGATPVPEVVVDDMVHDLLGAQVYPSSQQPPPKLAAQACQLVEQTEVVCKSDVVMTLVVVGAVVVVDWVETEMVWLTMTVTTKLGLITPIN